MKKKLVLWAAGLGLVFSLNAQLTTPVSITGASYSWQHQVSTGDGSYYLFDVTRNVPRFIIDGNTGNIGIGTENVSSKLQIKTSFSSALRIERLGSNTFGFEIGGTTFGLFDYTNLQYRWRTDGNNLLLVESIGNIGIGTTSPQAKLHIETIGDENAFGFFSAKGTGAAGIYFDASDGDLRGRDYGSLIQNNDLSIDLTSAGEYPINFKTNDIARMTVLGNGNVLIGKTTQNDGVNYKLDVAGSIRANEIKVNTTGADFVFEPTYKLRTLAEVESFIKQNKHLPDVAPAAEMQTNGVSMGEMQAKLLQKVEELTLYSIEQEKANAELKQRLVEQEKEMKELKQLVMKRLN